MADMVNPTAPQSGTVVKIDENYAYIRPDKEKVGADGKTGDTGLIKVPYETNFPLAAKTHLTHTLNVKKGTRVREGQQIADSNFTRDGKLALGRNLRVAYMPYYGANSNDAVVISEGAAKKLTSERMYTLRLPVDKDVSLSRDKHRAYYGHGYEKSQYGVLDSKGVIRPGTKINPHDPLILGLRKTPMTADDLLLGRLHRSLAQPYREENVVWDHDHQGEVVDVVRTPKRVTVTVKTKEPMGIGDKLCYTEDHDVLTKRGWVPVAEVTYDDACYTVNPAGVIELHNPTALNQYPEAGELYELATQQISLRVTPNHNLYVKRRGHDTFELIEAKNAIGKRVRHKKDGIWEGTTPEFFTIPAVKPKPYGVGLRQIPPIPTLAWCTFLGIYLADGCYLDCPNKKTETGRIYRVDIKSKEGNQHSISGDKSAWIQRVLDACGFTYYRSKLRFSINSRVLTEYVSQFGKRPCNPIP